MVSREDGRTHHDTLWVEQCLDLLHHLYRLVRLRVADIWRLHDSETMLGGDGSIVVGCRGTCLSLVPVSQLPQIQVKLPLTDPLVDPWL